ncbi:putative nuclease HARBI1 [Anopheles maculipalpis]|uniref:putative nuclease HARBI1 n=1 Tax=Anopheles maculipalpis TaxID=1496333 RepID=UPI0021596DB7|nr:putative nuclease HARBI1 [Anopheles maculipalpis]
METEYTDHHLPNSPMLVVQIVNEYRAMLQQQIALHLKRSRDHIARMRQRFLLKLAHRLHRNYELYDRTRRRMLMEVTLLNTRGRDKRRRKSVRGCAKSPVLLSVSDHQFDEIEYEQFRMDQGTFEFLFDMLEPQLTPAAILSTRTILAVAIYVLGSGKGYQSAAAKYGIDASLVQDCVRLFCRAVMNVFRTQVTTMPLDDDSIQLAVKEFEEFVGIPQMFGAVGCLHVPIKPTSKELAKYVNSKGWSSIILQAVVDRNGRFVDVSCDHPGGLTNPADMLINSTLYQRMEQLVDAPTETVGNGNVAPFLLGDNKYPLLPWLITPYPVGECMTTTERSFNVYAAKGRSCIGKAFDRLVGRWKVLNRCIEQNEASEQIVTCCILHNIVEQRESPYLDAWNECHNEEDIAPEQPQWECQIVSIDGEEVRNKLSKYMHDHFPVILDDED